MPKQEQKKQKEDLKVNQIIGVIRGLQEAGTVTTGRQIRGAVGMSGTAFKAAMDRAITKNLIQEDETVVRGKKVACFTVEAEGGEQDDRRDTDDSSSLD